VEQMVFGYARVSTKEQNEGRQIEALKQAGVGERNIFLDKETGRHFDRPQWKAMLSMLRSGDLLYVLSIDRVGRNYTEIAEQWEYITHEKGADIVVLDMPILDTRKDRDLTGTLIADIVLKLLSYVAEKERDAIHTRQAEGIALAKERGVYKGRKPIEIDKEAFEAAYGEVERGDRTSRWAMRTLGLKSNTYYKAVASYKKGWK
jgi:DNA invertase Pin-like site-specific DNA recombinase